MAPRTTQTPEDEPIALDGEEGDEPSADAAYQDDASEDEPTNTRSVEPQAVLLDGRYRIRRLIARGGMSVVHLAEQVDLQRDVALKVLRPPASVHDRFDFSEAFKQEARTLASLRHPNVVTLHDFGRVGRDEVFLAMEYVDGRPLSQVLEEGPLAPLHAVRLMLQVCLALRYTHGRGVIHKDVKPSNLMVTLDDEGEELIKVIDFGIAGGDLDVDRDLVIGSPDCMAPEQITGDPVVPATDVYGVGCVLFRAIAGRYPYVGSSAEDKLVAHVTETVPVLSEIATSAEVSPDLDEIVRRCLQKEAALRYQDMDGLIDDLAAFLGLPDTGWRTGSFIAPRALRLAAEGAAASPPDTLATVRPRSVRPRSTPTEVPEAADASSSASSDRLPLVLAIGAAVVLVLTAALIWPSGDPAPVVAEPPSQAASPAPPEAVEAPAGQATVAEPAPPTPKPAAPAPAPEAEASPPPRRRSAPRATKPEPQGSATPTPPPAARSAPPASAPAEDEGADEVEAPKGYKAMPEF
ncbi:MAG: serine/threonine protein kinase [Alphaproteobacteria bacterium]|nr:serine/threonine protein kinase [Alphaproteobacteria bacterium]